MKHILAPIPLLTLLFPALTYGVTMKRNKLVNVICSAFLLPLFATSAWGLELKKPDGQNVEANSFPLIEKRQKLQSALYDGQMNGSFGLAMSGGICVTNYSWAWGGDDPVSRSLSGCDRTLGKILLDYPKKIQSKCSCVSVIKDDNIARLDILKYPFYKQIIKLYIKQKSGSLETVRGFLEFETPALSKQKIRILNAENSEVCAGEMELSTGDGSFNLICPSFGEAYLAAGIATIKAGIFTKTHSTGSALLSDGSVFAFITSLTDKEITEKYPNFPSYKANKKPQEANDYPQ